MQTITIDILNQKVLKLLQDLELLQLIRLRKQKKPENTDELSWSELKGAMSKEPINAVDKQLDDLRGAWD